MNARFWTWTNDGWVKLSIKPGQSLAWQRKGPTDEGWFVEGKVWEHTGEGVSRLSVARGRDCDGVHGHEQEDFCPLGDLAAVVSYGADRDREGRVIFRPDWQADRPSVCYDQFAEAAGY